MTTAQPIRIDAPPRDLQAEAVLRKELGIRSLLASVLVARNLRDPQEAHTFLNPSLDQLGDPRLLPDYAIARDEILGARERGDLIFIHGDYDVDGVTSAALFGRFLEKIGCKVHVHVPHRMKEGYGVHERTVQAAHDLGAKLFLTCDCGIAAHEQVDQARELGLRVVVTDHHHVGECLPNALAVVNPHRHDSQYPYANLCGAGVVFRLCEGLAAELNMPVDGFRRAYLDLAVLGTVADVMPLTGENRIIARFGVEELARTKKHGIRALLEVSQLAGKKKLKTGNIGFQLGPRLNAAGRIDDASRALALLLSRDDSESKELAEELDRLNTDRKDREKQMVEQAVEEVAALDLSGQYAIVVGSANWHPGIVGLVAGRLREKFNRPAYAYTINEQTGIVKGSARSIPGFHLAESIEALAPLMGGGGHAMAAGFHAELAQVEKVKQAINEYAAQFLTHEDFIPRVEVDVEPNTDELSLHSVREMIGMEPFGQANWEPTFAMKNAKIFDAKAVRNGAVQVNIQPEGGHATKAVMYGYEEGVPEWFKPGVAVNACVQVALDDYTGFDRMEYRIKLIEPLS